MALSPAQRAAIEATQAAVTLQHNIIGQQLTQLGVLLQYDEDYPTALSDPMTTVGDIKTNAITAADSLKAALL